MNITTTYPQVTLELSISQILSLIDQLEPAEQLLVSRRLDQTWAERFEALLDRVQARVPSEIPEAEVLRDVAEAVREVRALSASA